MANQTRQQVADQLNKLNSQGASEQEIVNYVTSAGYNPGDFNVDLNGSFRPMVVGTGTVTQNYSAAEEAESNSFYQNLAASSSTTEGKPIANVTSASSTTNTVTTTQITNFQQTTGGGTTTVYSTPSTPTPASEAFRAQADQSFSLAESYRLNPDSKFGKSALDRRLADGRLTQEQYNEIINSTPEQRAAQATQYSNQYEQARTNENAAKAGGNPVVEVTPAQNTSEISVQYQKTTTTESTRLSGEVLGTSVKTETIDGVTYQVTTDNAGTTVLTSPDGFSVPENDVIENEIPEVVSDQVQGAEVATEDFYTPLSTPPGTDEFDGIDTQIENNENALQEPPVLSDEEVDTYLNNLPQEEVENREPKLVSDIQGPAYDDEGNIMPGWSLNEDNDPVWVGNNSDGSIFVEPATQASADASRAAAQGLTAKKLDTNSQATQQDVANFKQKEDWRVRLSLAPNSNYLYNVPKGSAGILEPLKATDGVIFPYTPTITVNYTATYDPTDITHSNYKIYQYKNSGVDAISISCEFTAQDTYEANYLLAVIHFFKSVTKMFYGQDQNPKPGTPPPLCYLSGLGAFQFDAHPLAITSFNYSLPNDVDYIRAGAVTAGAGVNRSPSNVVTNNATNILGLLTQGRLGSLKPGGVQAAPVFTTPPGTVDPTYVPTRIQMTIGAIPIVTRNDISNKFSLKDYATGSLLRGSRRQGGGIW